MLLSWEKIIFSGIILITAFAFLYPLYYRFRILRAAQPELRLDNILKRILNAAGKILLQKCTLKNERVWTGLMHVLIFYGALTFDTMTINHTLEGYFADFFIFGNTALGFFFSFMVDVFAVLVLIGVFFFIIRRFLIRPKAYATTPLDSALIYFFLISVTLSYLYFEAFAIASHPHTARLSFLGQYLAQLISQSGAGPAAIAAHFKISWWLHILLVFAFIAYVPHSKYLHMIAGSLNVFFRSSRLSGELRPLNLEQSEIYGLEKSSDLTWKDGLDAFACMECGRCQDACPAFQSEKPLSPKMLIFNLEKHLLKDGKKLIRRHREDLKPLVPDVHSEGEIWTCTTCGACRHVCPVEIEHIPKIVGMRQSQVLMKSQFPQELNSFFRNMETNSNPWGVGFSKRAEWMEGLSIPLIKDFPDADHLFWIGCAGSFDEEGIKIAKAFASLLKKANIRFAVLGTGEKCCGDSVRRLGNEYLFQTLAEENIHMFARYHIQKILTICPHGYNTFKNEYPKLLPLISSLSEEEKSRVQKIEIVHHVQFLQRLLQEGRFPLKSKISDPLTYHDSCYLGRHNAIIQEPRGILAEMSASKIIELKNCREHSFCCGAGGGLMWTEESLGQRINHLRTDEVLDSQAKAVATSCPFCLTMLRDGLKDKGREDIAVKDIAQFLAEAIE
ncbi:MAG: heterodisulfide reductase-related iron-sulfur binding cluster [Candidatus Aminicenantales bacterium]